MTLNEGLKAIQEKARQQSIETVTWAVEFIKDTEGVNGKITAQKLAEVTNLSRAVLYKKHIRGIWDVNWKQCKKLSLKPNDVVGVDNPQLQIDELTYKLSIVENKNEKLKRKLEQEQTRLQINVQEIKEIKEKHQKLLYQYLKILRELHIRGIKIEDLNIESSI
ncbi:hypothetical protein GH884_14450 [Bacillus thuringiensis]|nr:hypothetical protein [Bacillus thuringiensis]